MSRTYRRKNAKHTEAFCTRYHSTPSFRYSFFGVEYWTVYGSYFDHYPTEKEIKKAKVDFHRDSSRWSFKEPGPAWFRNLFTERPQRRKSKNELRKFMLDSDYEPMIESKDVLPYWT